MKVVLAFQKKRMKPVGRQGVRRRKGELVLRSEFFDHAEIRSLCREWRKHTTVVVIDQHRIANRLRQMNWHFGRGEVKRVEWNSDTSGTVVRLVPVTPRNGLVERRRFHVVADTVFFVGHRSYLGRPLRL